MLRHHAIVEIKSPVTVIVRCECGWSHTETRRQNALARDAKIRQAKRSHIERVQPPSEDGILR